jgi:hypothetical protein
LSTPVSQTAAKEMPRRGQPGPILQIAVLTAVAFAHAEFGMALNLLGFEAASRQLNKR